MVPCVEMFTTAGDTRLIIGESEGTGVSPPTAEGTEAGSAAWAGAVGLVRNATATRGAVANRRRRKRGARDMADSRSIVSPALILMVCCLSERQGQTFSEV